MLMLLIFHIIFSGFCRKLLEGEESRFNVGMGGLVGAYSVGPVYSRPMYSLSSLSSGAPYLLSSRLVSASLSADEAITSSQAQEAAASPTQEEEEEEKEEEEQNISNVHKLYFYGGIKAIHCPS